MPCSATMVLHENEKARKTDYGHPGFVAFMGEHSGVFNETPLEQEPCQKFSGA